MRRTADSDIIAIEGYPFIAIAALLVLGGYCWGRLPVIIALVLFIFVVSFFRNPRRVVPSDTNTLISGADGKVIKVEEVDEKRYAKKRMQKISIFMSPLNVHVNRIPMTGRVKEVFYNPGKFLGAFDDKASLDNEQNAILLQTDTGDEIVFVQIAGFLARRIVCYAKAGESWNRGSIFGLIRFGSRMDLYFPLSYTVKVRVGDVVKSGETILATR